MLKALKSHSFIGCSKGIKSFSCDIAFLFPAGKTGDTDGGAGLLGNKGTPESLKRYKLNGKFLLVLAREEDPLQLPARSRSIACLAVGEAQGFIREVDENLCPPQYSVRSQRIL